MTSKENNDTARLNEIGMDVTQTPIVRLKGLQANSL